MSEQPYKRCRVCDVEKPLDAFNRYRRSPDGHDSLCRDCNRARQREYREKNPHKKQEWVEKNRERYGETRRRQRRDPKKREAHRRVQYAVEVGRLVKSESCEGCGAAGCRIEGHHHDYDKPLEVRWLCSTCHRAEHLQPEVAEPQEPGEEEGSE